MIVVMLTVKQAVPKTAPGDGQILPAYLNFLAVKLKTPKIQSPQTIPLDNLTYPDNRECRW